MRRVTFCLSVMLASLTTAGIAAPAAACSYSLPVFSAQQNGAAGVPTRVRVGRTLLERTGGPIVAVRATVLQESRAARAGDNIVIVLPTYPPGNCYYWDLYDPDVVTDDGTLVAYVDLLPAPDPAGVFAAAAANRGALLRYNRSDLGRRGQWVRPRFRRDAE